MRKFYMYMVCCLIFCANIPLTEQGVLSIGKALFSFGLSVFNTALSLVELLDDEESGGVTQEDLDKLKADLLQDIGTMIEETESSILLNVMLQTGVNRLETIRNAIKSSLGDLSDYLKTTTSTDQTTYRDLFVKRFEEHNVIVYIRELPTLLTDSIPELSKSMISLIWDTTNCNMTAVMQIETFYANLVSEAATLEYAHTRFKNYSLVVVEAEWNESLAKIQAAFDTMVNECVDRFLSSMTEEFKQDMPLENLKRQSSERYNWRWNDLFEYEPLSTGSHALVYFVTLKDEEFLFWNGPKSGQNRIMLFGDKNKPLPKWNKTVVQSQLEANVGRFRGSIPVNGENTAMAIGKEVATFLNDEISFIYKGIFVFHEVSGNPFTALIDEQYSPVAYVGVSQGSGLRYHSVYHIYVYPEVWNNFTSYNKLYNENNHVSDNAATDKLDIRFIFISFIILRIDML